MASKKRIKETTPVAPKIEEAKAIIDLKGMGMAERYKYCHKFLFEWEMAYSLNRQANQKYVAQKKFLPW